MMVALLGFVIVIGLPIAALVGLLKTADALQRRRLAVITRQIEVTDAIHREFGAVVAPTVRRARGGWRVTLPMEIGHPAASRIAALAMRTLGPGATVEVAIVPPWVAARRRPGAQNRERIAAAMSA